jgi:phosphoglycolate phosphatase
MTMAAPRYRLVVFDFDGTLADSFPWFLDNVNRAAERYGFRPLPVDRLEEYRGLGNRELIARLGLPLWKLPRVVAGMREAMAEGLDRIRLFDGALPLLRALRARGVGCAIVSSNSRDNIARVLGGEGVALVDHLGCGASLFGKRALLRRVAHAAQVPAAAILCVGDEQRDAEAAQAVGMDFVGVGWGFATPAALQACSGRPVLQHFDDLLALL